MSYERDALRNLEDARRTARVWRRIIGSLLAVKAVAVAGFVVGLFIAVWSNVHGWDGGSAAAALILPGVLIPVVTGFAFAAYWDLNEPAPFARLRRAERRYEDILMGD